MLRFVELWNPGGTYLFRRIQGRERTDSVLLVIGSVCYRSVNAISILAVKL